MNNQQSEAVRQAQKLLDEVMDTHPFGCYAAARQLGLIDDRLSLLDQLQNAGLIKTEKICACRRGNNPWSVKR